MPLPLPNPGYTSTTVNPDDILTPGNNVAPLKPYLDMFRQWLLSKQNVAPGPTTGPENNPAPPSGLARTAEAATHPIDQLSGGLKNLWESGKSIASVPSNFLQAISGIPVLGASDPMASTTKPGFAGALDILGQQASRLNNIISFGAHDKVLERYDNAQKVEGPARKTEDNVRLLLGAIKDTATNDYLPGEELMDVMRGEKQIGTDADGKPITRPLTGEDLGADMSSATQKIFMLHGFARTSGLREGLGAGARLGDLVPEKQSMQKALSRGEIADAKIGGRVAKGATPTPLPEIRPDPNVPLEATGGDALAGPTREAATALAPPTLDPRLSRLLTEDQQRSVIAHTMQGTVIDQVVQDVGFKSGKTGAPINEVIARAVESGALADSGDLAVELARKFNVPLEEAGAATANAIRETSSFGGSVMQPLAEASHLIEGKLLLKAQAGDVAAAEALKRYRTAADLTFEQAKNSNALWRYWGQKFNKGVERYRLGAMVGQIPTAMRNGVSQMGAVYFTNVFEDIATGIANTIVGKDPLNSTTVGQYFGDAIESIAAPGALLDANDRAIYNDAINNFPLVKEQLEASPSSLQQFAQLSTLQKMQQKGFGSLSTGEKAIAGVNVGHILNQTNEILSRRLFMRARLGANLSAVGETMESLTNESKSGALPDHMRIAVADAYEHAMKQTFAWTPETGPTQAILNTFRDVPGLTAVSGIPFPRFLINSLRYSLERSPHMFFDLFSPDFRAQLYAGAEGGIATRNAARQLGKATSGFLNLAAAYYMRTQHGGAHWYDYKSPGIIPTTNANDSHTIDIRSYSPHDRWAATAYLIDQIQKGEPPNLPADEWVDLMTGVGRVSDSPMFGLTDILKNLDSQNQDTVWNKGLASPAGKYFASFFTPVQQLKSIYGIAGHPEALVRRDQQGQPLSAPLANMFPGASETLPARVSPYNGQDTKDESPTLRLLLGIGVTSSTKLQNLLETTPGFNANQFFGTTKDNPIANNAIRKNIGEMLNAPFDDKQTFGDYFADTLEKANLKPEERLHQLSEWLSEVKKSAVEKAMAEEPDAFVTDLIGNEIKDPAQQKLLLDVWRKSGLKLKPEPSPQSKR